MSPTEKAFQLIRETYGRQSREHARAVQLWTYGRRDELIQYAATILPR
jgi:hypothetical protein